MLGVLICLFISWILLRFRKENLSVLGIKPNLSRLNQLFSGFMLSLILASVYFLYTVHTLEASVSVNSNYTADEFLRGAGWTLRSVLFEELVFRGVLFYFLIRWLGAKWAVIISSVVFGVYHWFSYSVFGDLQSMVYVFLLTFMGGFVFAFAFVVTKSIYLPVGLHFGWNLASVIVFSQGPLQLQFLLIEDQKDATAQQSLIFFILQFIVFPGLMLLYIWFLKTRRKSSETVAFVEG